jgi:hypothetical protein
LGLGVLEFLGLFSEGLELFLEVLGLLLEVFVFLFLGRELVSLLIKLD